MDHELNRGNTTIQYSYLVVNTVPTRLLTIGNTSLDWNCKAPLLLLIPGNPGIIDYYEQFLQEIYEYFGGTVHVCGISHAGHDHVPETFSEHLSSVDPFFYGLEGQVQHKLHFIEENVSDGRPLFLAAHSIGSYIALQIMDRRPQLQVRWAFLLFPVFERFAETPNARQMFGHPILLQIGLWIAEHLLMLVPVLLKTLFVKYYYQDLPSEQKTHIERATLVLLTPAAFRLVFHMALQEAEQVRDRDDDMIRRHVSRLTFYYGASDLWCPTRFYEEMKRDFPEADLHLCPHNLKHAFVLDRTRELSTFVAKKMNDSLEK